MTVLRREDVQSNVASWDNRPYRRHNPPISTRSPPEDVPRLVQELEVHQIELELQNEELRRVQSEIEQSRDRLGDLYDFAQVGYLTLIQDTVIVEANLKAAALLGVERGTLVGQRFTVFLARESQDAFHLGQLAVGAGRSPWSDELIVRKADGAPLPVSMGMMGSAEPGGAPSWRCSITDIATGKHSIGEPRKSEDRYRGLAEQVLDGIFVADSQGRYRGEELTARRPSCFLSTSRMAPVLA